VLPGRALLGNHNGYWNPAILKRLREREYDAIILGGYNHFTMLAAAWYAHRKRIPFYLMSEVYLRQPRAAWKKLVKAPFLRFLLRQAAGGLPTGTLACEYLEFYGLKRAQMCFVPNVPDIETLRSQAQDLWKSGKMELRKSLGLDAAPMILFVGRLLALKNVHVLIAAFNEIRKAYDLQLVIIGDGPERQRLTNLCKELGCADRVRFAGFVAPQKLVSWYCAADVFVLPSSDETWGVVVLESLACGTPVIVSDMVGSAPDVVNSPEVGSIIPANDVSALTRALELRLKNTSSPERVAKVWEPVAQKMSYQFIAHELVEFLRKSSSVGGQ